MPRVEDFEILLLKTYEACRNESSLKKNYEKGEAIIIN